MADEVYRDSYGEGPEENTSPQRQAFDMVWSMIKQSLVSYLTLKEIAKVVALIGNHPDRQACFIHEFISAQAPFQEEGFRIQGRVGMAIQEEEENPTDPGAQAQLAQALNDSLRLYRHSRHHVRSFLVQRYGLNK